MSAYDLAIIGGGPGGYVAALRAAQLGLRTVLFEKDRIGGLCLNWGCIPTKALLKNADAVNTVRASSRWGISIADASYDLGVAVDRSRSIVGQLVEGVEGLLREAEVEMVRGAATFRGLHEIAVAEDPYEAGATIIATGATTKYLPGIPLGGPVITSREALEVREPPKRAVVVGAGPVGVEFAHLWASYGSEVTVIELLDTLLPLKDRDLGRALRQSFQGRGITCLTKTKVESVEVEGAEAVVTVSRGEEKEQISTDLVLVAIGFIPHTEGLGLESVGVSTENGFVTIGDHMETNVLGIYAVGDVTGKLMLAHVASQQGTIAAEHIAGRTVPALDYIQLPRATFCQPHVGSVGYTEVGAKEAGFSVKTGRFPFTALGKAVTAGNTEGFAKVVADEGTGQVLGIHLIGHDVNDLLGEASLAMLLEVTTVELGFAVHAHPTLTEAIKESALAVNGEAIHMSRRRALPSKREHQ